MGGAISKWCGSWAVLEAKGMGVLKQMEWGLGGAASTCKGSWAVLKQMEGVFGGAISNWNRQTGRCYKH